MAAKGCKTVWGGSSGPIASEVATLNVFSRLFLPLDERLLLAGCLLPMFPPGGSGAIEGYCS